MLVEVEMGANAGTKRRMPHTEARKSVNKIHASNSMHRRLKALELGSATISFITNATNLTDIYGKEKTSVKTSERKVNRF